MHDVHGGCHCGNLRYVLTWPLAGDPPVRTCSCSFCVKQGAVYTAHPQAKLAVTAPRAAAIADYSFGTKSAVMHCCPNCGVLVFVSSIIDGRRYGVINANTLDGFARPAEVEVFDLESDPLEKRLARRRKVWIPDVTVTIGS